MKIIEIGPREIGFVLWGHCQNLLDDPRNPSVNPLGKCSKMTISAIVLK